MNIRLICVGKIKEKYLNQGIAEYRKRLSRYAKLEIAEVPDERAAENLSLKEMDIVKQKEAAGIERLLRKDSIKVVLDIKGKALDSEGLADYISNLAVTGKSQIDFIIGGSIGLDDSIRKQGDLLLSFSSFTFPHQLMRLILLEQIYRAFKIINNEPYHK
ncbi:MAG: 23S rRNA (pseudouridine(1915)-N(3))-methyltransferase RlmH [Eubacteriales bacterium]|nr:23S rRNA (pseudouridine(1915)-N(3))-methyltransferase RlmH [Bacillota bacterium]